MPEEPTLRLSKMKGQRIRLPRVLPIITILVLFVLVLLAGRPQVSPRALDISHNGVHAPYNVRNKRGELLFYNFRAVEEGVVYRGSAFPINKRGVLGGKRGIFPAANYDRTAFDFFRAKKIRTIVSMLEPNRGKREEGYFKHWSKATGYKINVVAFPIKPEFAYDRNALRLVNELPRDRWFGLKAASQFIEFMRQRPQNAGAVYLKDAAGKDSVGIVAAAYEMWRNQGQADREALWQQVLKRYLTSNVVIARAPDAARDTGPKTACGANEAPNFVCSKNLESLRADLERIAKL